MGSKNFMGRSAAQATTSAKGKIVPFGRIASGNYLKIHIKNVADSEAREIRVLTPYGFVSGPMPDLFAQIIMNDHINNTCPGIWNEKAPEAKPGEVILYNKGKCQIKLGEDDSIKITNGAATIELTSAGVINLKGVSINLN